MNQNQQQHDDAVLREAFELFDKDRSGYIDSNELGNTLRVLGLNPSEYEIKQMIAKVDTDGNGKLDFNEFCNLMKTCNLTANDDPSTIVAAFNVFDKNGDGFITADELRDIMCSTGEKMTEAEVQQMIKEADKNGDGRIDIQEFAALMFQ